MAKKRRKPKAQNRPRSNKDNSIESAIRLHQAGKLAAAEKAYRRALRSNPRDPHALYLCGVVNAQLENHTDAIDLLRQAVGLNPDHPQSLSELAKLYQLTGQLEESATTLRQLIALRPDIGDLHNNLAIVLKQLDQPDEAKAACQTAIEMNPDRAEPRATLASIQRQLGAFEEAAASYRQAIELDPNLDGIYRDLIATLRDHGQSDEIAAVAEAWLQHEPENPVAHHMLAIYGDAATPERTSDGYVREVFDEFAATFDESLQGLDYQGPQLIARALAEEPGDTPPLPDVLDAGCGTGLCGPVLRPISTRLIGVDLSSMMLERAKKLDLYDQLVEAELTGYLEQHPKSYDLIVAADTFNYFGALPALLEAAASALKESGRLIFTLEHSEDADATDGYQLNPNGRYSHQEDYVKTCLADQGLDITCLTRATLRKEKDQPVAALVISARKG